MEGPTSGTPVLADEPPPVDSWAPLFYGGAVVLAIVGIVMMFVPPRIVGGDAYNVIIGAIRGAGFIGAAILFGLFGLARRPR